MHVYKVDSTEWATEFVRNMLGAPSTTQTDREPISPFPPGYMMKTEEKQEMSNGLKTAIKKESEEE